MAWTNLNFNYGAVLTSTQMTQLDDNFEAMAAGDSGAPSIQEAAMGSASVNQAALKTTTHTASTVVSPGSTINVILTGGTYIQGWQTWQSNNTYPGSTNFATGAYNTTAATYAGFTNNGVGSMTMYFLNRYVQASPPYDLGDGDVAGFIFALVDNATRSVQGVSIAEDPPWANNGPTDIRPNLIIDGRKYQRRQRRLRRLAEAADDPVLRAELFAELQSAPMETVEITQAVKQADMPLIPHPWHVGNDLTGKTVVLLDPVSDLVARLAELHNAGENVNEILHADYLRPDNTALQRSGPPGVRVVTARWRNTG